MANSNQSNTPVLRYYDLSQDANANYATYKEMVEKNPCIESLYSEADYLKDYIQNVPITLVQMIKMKKYFESDILRFLACLTGNDCHGAVIMHTSVGVFMLHQCCGGNTDFIKRNQEQHETFMNNHASTWFMPTTD